MQPNSNVNANILTATTTPAVPAPNLTDKENAQRGQHIQLLMQCAMVRESAQPQFDGMGYSMYNQTNEMADMSFLPPKKNKAESRLVTGITHEKDTTLLSMLLNFNFEVKIRAFDEKNLEQVELGEVITAMVRKSRELENYDEKRPIHYRNLLVQGTSFTRERYVESWVPKKIINTDEIDFTRLDTIKWTDAGYEKIYDGCTSDLVDGKKVFLQNIRVQDIRKQPRVFTVEYIPRENAQTIFGEMERWKNVPYTITPTSQASYLTLASIYADWTFAEIDNTKVEVFEVFEPFDRTYQLYLNGVPMLPVNYPITAISPSGLIPIAKGDLDPMNMFAYSKSIPAKTKIDQATMDEVAKVMVLKFQQSARPPKGNIGDKIVTENIFIPGRITPDVRAEDLPDLMTTTGITNSDFSFFNLLTEQIGNKSISKEGEGQDSGQDITAIQYMDMQKKQMLKLGASIDAVINWEKQIAHLRTIDLTSNWTKKVDQHVDGAKGKLTDMYRTISVDDTFDDGKEGLRVIKFQPNHGKTATDVYDEEMKTYKENGQEVRLHYIDPNWLKALKVNFYYEIIPTDKYNDKLTQVMFLQTLTQAMQIFGPQSLNVDYLKKRFAQVMGEDFDNFFLSASQQQPQQTDDKGNPIPMAGGVTMPQPGMKDIMQQK